MSSVHAHNPPTQDNSKSAKKKKAKAALAAEERTASPAPSGSPVQGTSVAGNDSSESPYIRELRKIIRNTTKKIVNASKTQSIILENKDKSIEQLLAAKIINADQRRQVDNKPALEAELARTEEQLAQVLKLDEEWRATVASVKADTEKSLTEKYEQEKVDAIAEVKSKAETDVKEALEAGFLVLSQFLRLAAKRRQEAENSEEDSDLAIEGILLSVYTGDHAAVAAMSKLYQGSDDTTAAIDGTPLQTTFGQVREQAVAAAQAAEPTEEDEEPLADEGVNEVVADASAPSESAHPVQTDPTVAYAGLTEIDAGTDIALTNGHTNGITPETEVEAPIPNADTGDSAANAAGESQWDTANDLAASQEWVEIQKPAEVPQSQVQAAPAATPAAAPAPAASSNPSWADEQPEPSAARTPTETSDGFQSVQRNRGRGNGEGFRGGRGGHFRGGRGGNAWRGDGGRGRGRGGPRGPRNGDNAGPRRDGGGKATE
ncbi:unnamed protein product [Discula destructiva]